MTPQDLMQVAEAVMGAVVGAMVGVVGEAAEVPAAANVLMVAAAVAGAVMWLMGRRLAKAAGMLAGLFVGGVVGLLVGNGLAEEGAFTWSLVVGAAIAGALLALLLFRVWVGGTAAVLVGLAAPAAVLVLQGTPPVTPSPSPTSGSEAAEAPKPRAVQTRRPERGADSVLELPEQPRGEPLQAAELQGNGTQGPGGGLFDFPARGETGEQQPPGTTADVDEAGADLVVPEDTAARRAGRVVLGVGESIRGLWSEQAASVRAWWEGLDEAVRASLQVTALIGGIIGLAGGLLLPLHMASLETALVGSVLMLVPGRAVAMEAVPRIASYLPQSPRGLVVAVGLLTLLGYLVQWSLWRKRGGAKRE